ASPGASRSYQLTGTGGPEVSRGRAGPLAHVLREYHGIAKVMPGGGIKCPAAGNEPQGRPARIAVDGQGRKVCLLVQGGRVDLKQARAVVLQGDVDEVARAK